MGLPPRRRAARLAIVAWRTAAMRALKAATSFSLISLSPPSALPGLTRRRLGDSQHGSAPAVQSGLALAPLDERERCCRWPAPARPRAGHRLVVAAIASPPGRPPCTVRRSPGGIAVK